MDAVTILKLHFTKLMLGAVSKVIQNVIIIHPTAEK